MRLYIALVIAAALLGCGSKPGPVRFQPNRTSTDTTTAPNPPLPSGKLLSAFFGLDHALPGGADLRVCLGAGHEDGMPVIFDREIDVSTLQAGDFEVTMKSGRTGQITCVTMAPALDTGELRTVLVAGDYGTKADPPVEVRVTGYVFSKDGKLNYQGAKIAVNPLEDGPFLVFAETVPAAEWKAGVTASSWGNGTGCPVGTKQAIRVTWAGGVKRPDGKDAGDEERQLYKVGMEGGSVTVPMALADLGDGDNNHLLCFNFAFKSTRVFFPKGHLVDPNGDLNPATTVPVTPRP